MKIKVYSNRIYLYFQKMINKFLSIFVILVVIHILLIFKAPEIATLIEKTLWINWFTEFVIWSKSTYDNAINKLPNSQELNNSYNDAFSWANKLKENVLDWAEYTKDKIDWFRNVMSWAENTYNDLKDWINTAKEFIDTASWAINDTKELIDNVNKVTETLTNSWETNTWTTN